MGRPPSVGFVKRRFLSRLDSNENLYAAVEPFLPYTPQSMADEPLHPTQARRVVGLCFLSNIAGFEEFVVATFVRYLAGASSQSGYRPGLRLGACKNLAHAAEVIGEQTGYDMTTHYLSWRTWATVVSKAKLYFERGEPYTRIAGPYRQRLDDSFVIRDRVAHSSRKCITSFCEAARRFLAIPAGDPLPQGFSVGKLLVHGHVRGFRAFDRARTFFDAYNDLLRHVAAVIAP